jgi:hypothetical protein
MKFKSYCYYLSKKVSLLIILMVSLVSTDLCIAVDKDSTNKVDLSKKNKFTPFQYNAKDSSAIKDNQNDDNEKPGKRYLRDHTPFQDSAYYKAMRIRIPAAVRLSNDLHTMQYNWAQVKNLAQEQPWESAQRNLNIPAEFFKPDPIEVVNRREMLQRAQYVPYINTLPPENPTLSASLSTIGRMLGIIEDVTPEIKFSIDYTDEIEITIFSIQASAVATIFKGELSPGSYKYVWNLRDDFGKAMPAGDYIAEVRVGKIKYFRKRIQIP